MIVNRLNLIFVSLWIIWWMLLHLCSLSLLRKHCVCFVESEGLRRRVYLRQGVVWLVISAFSTSWDMLCVLQKSTAGLYQINKSRKYSVSAVCVCLTAAGEWILSEISGSMWRKGARASSSPPPQCHIPPSMCVTALLAVPCKACHHRLEQQPSLTSQGATHHCVCVCLNDLLSLNNSKCQNGPLSIVNRCLLELYFQPIMATVWDTPEASLQVTVSWVVFNIQNLVG